MSKSVKSSGNHSKWSVQDARILFSKIESLAVGDDTEIDWKLLPDADWNLWSAHVLQRRWLTMKKSVGGYEAMKHQGERLQIIVLPILLINYHRHSEYPARQTVSRFRIAVIRNPLSGRPLQPFDHVGQSTEGRRCYGAKGRVSSVLVNMAHSKRTSYLYLYYVPPCLPVAIPHP